jgi:DNA-binding NtrC family response regulator
MFNQNNKKRILIIENNDDVNFLLKDLNNFKNFIIEIESVDNEFKAIKKLEKKPFDIIIIDIHRLDQLNILPLFKKYQPDVSIIIFPTFGAKKKTFQKAFEKGATVVVEKPIDFQRLKMLIFELISLNISDSN